MRASMLSDERGVSTVEYLIVLALVALASLGAWTWLGGNVDREVRCTAGAIGGSGAGGCRPEGARGGGPIAAAPDLARDDLGALIAEGTPPAQRARIEEALSSLPESVVSALLAQGTTIVAARGGVSDGAEELSAVRPRGWPKDSTFEDVEAAYLPGRNSIVVALDAAGGDLSRVLAHEIGHALDLPRGLSNDAAFRTAYDSLALAPGSYFAQPGRAGREEALAESFSLYLTDPARLRETAPALARYWETRLAQPIGAASRALLARAGEAPRPFSMMGWDPVDAAKDAWSTASGGRRAIMGAGETYTRLMFDPSFKLRFAYGALEGGASLLVDTAKGLYQMVRHPIATARALGDALTTTDTIFRAGDAVGRYAAGAVHAFVGGDAHRLGEIAGEATVTVAGTVGTGGATATARAGAVAGKLSAATRRLRVATRAGRAPRAAAWNRSLATGFCFTAGTLIALGDGRRAPIEAVDLGARVRTSRSDADATVPAAADASAAWRRVVVELADPRSADGVVVVELLRERDWVDALGAQPGASIDLALPQMGIAGLARVESVAEAPPPAAGPGKLVLARIVSRSESVVALRFHGHDETLEPTAGHPLYSLDRHDWVPAGDLHAGERVATSHGSLAIASIEPRPGTHVVYNLEVDEDHEFLVSPLEIVSHNDNVCAQAASASALVARSEVRRIRAAVSTRVRNLTYRDIATFPYEHRFRLEQAQSRIRDGLERVQLESRDSGWFTARISDDVYRRGDRRVVELRVDVADLSDADADALTRALAKDSWAQSALDVRMGYTVRAYRDQGRITHVRFDVEDRRIFGPTEARTISGPTLPRLTSTGTSRTSTIAVRPSMRRRIARETGWIDTEAELGSVVAGFDFGERTSLKLSISRDRSMRADIDHYFDVRELGAPGERTLAQNALDRLTRAMRDDPRIVAALEQDLRYNDTMFVDIDLASGRYRGGRLWTSVSSARVRPSHSRYTW